MIKLICDWCGVDVRLKLSRLSEPQILNKADNSYDWLSEVKSKDSWYTNDTQPPASGHQPLGVDLCPECKNTAHTAKKGAEAKGEEILNSAVAKAEEEQARLTTDALEAAKRSCVPRLERDVTMRQKERQKLMDGQ